MENWRDEVGFGTIFVGEIGCEELKTGWSIFGIFIEAPVDDISRTVADMIRIWYTRTLHL
jgi:hypothetical protein